MENQKKAILTYTASVFSCRNLLAYMPNSWRVYPTSISNLSVATLWGAASESPCLCWRSADCVHSVGHQTPQTSKGEEPELRHAQLCLQNHNGGHSPPLRGRDKTENGETFRNSNSYSMESPSRWIHESKKKKVPSLWKSPDSFISSIMKHRGCHVPKFMAMLLPGQ